MKTLRKIGNCNMCGILGPLTRDHVPPKGSVKITQVLCKDFLSKLQMDAPSKARKTGHRLSQSGVYFASLCSGCNSYLGAELDHHFIAFVSRLISITQSSLILPKSIFINCNINKTIRSFIGHLIAVGNFEQSEWLRETFGSFVRGEESLPLKAKVYCWPFPYKTQHIVTSYHLIPDMAKGQTEALSYWLIKFPPIAFMLVWEQPSKFSLPTLTCLSDYLELGIPQSGTVEFKLDSKVPQFWPDYPGDSDAVMTSSNSTAQTAEPYSKPKKSRIVVVTE